MHLPHFEDYLAAGGDLTGLHHFADLLKLHAIYCDDTANYPLSTKIDGAPGIVYGRLPTGELFVSDKSFFNKNPIYFTEADFTFDVAIATYNSNKKKLSPVVARIMGDLISYIKLSNYMTIQPGTAFFGDWLGNAVRGTDYVMANILKYTVSSPNAQMVISMHTAYSIYDNKLVRAPIASKPDIPIPDRVLNIPVDIRLSASDINIAMIDKLISKCELLFRSDPYNISPDVKKARLRGVQQVMNKLARQGRSIDKIDALEFNSLAIGSVLSHTDTESILAVLKLATIVKHEIMYNCIHTTPKPVASLDNGITYCGHEGVVMDFGTNLVKLVHRSAFSWMNFHPQVVRGWKID